MPTSRIGTLEGGRFVRRQGTFVGVGTFARIMGLTQPYVASPHIEDGGDDISSFVGSALPKIEEFVKEKLTGYPQRVEG